MRGVVAFDTFFAKAQRRCLIEDCRGSAAVLTGRLYELAREKKMKVRVSRDPLTPEKIDGLFFPQSRTAFVVSRGEATDLPHRSVSMRRFVETSKMHGLRGDLNFAERMRRTMLEGGVEMLEEVRRIHFEVEKIYTGAMDFGAKERFTEAFCTSLFQK